MGKVTVTGYIVRNKISGTYLQTGGYYENYPSIFKFCPDAADDLEIIACDITFINPLRWLPIKLVDLVSGNADAIVNTVLQLEAEGTIRRVGKGWEKLQ